MENKVFAAARPEGVDGGLGHSVSLRKAVEAALPFVASSFTDQPLIEARLRMTLGTSFESLGEAKIAADQFQAARAIYTTHRGPDHPDTLEAMHELARSYIGLGRYAEALKLQRSDARPAKNQARPRPPRHAQHHARPWPIACTGLSGTPKRSSSTRRRWPCEKPSSAPTTPTRSAAMNGLANGYESVGRPLDALKLREETLALQKTRRGPDHPDTLGQHEQPGHQLR